MTKRNDLVVDSRDVAMMVVILVIVKWLIVNGNDNTVA